MQIGAWQKRTLYNILCFRGLCSKVVIPTGLEPISKEPESFILSIELGDQYLSSAKLIIFLKKGAICSLF